MPRVLSCDRCPEPAVETIRYAGVRLCSAHFLDFTQRRVKRELRRQGGVPDGATVGVAVSGGKDSISTLRLLHHILGPRLAPDSGGVNPRGDVRLVVLTVDEGIAGYRSHGLAVARDTARGLGLEHRVMGYRDLVGVTMDEVHTVKGDQNECTFCGVFRRASLNRLARDAGCDVLATGHNLDDNAQAVLMNTAGGDILRLARLGPHETVKEGLVPRRMPLRTIPEKEVYLTATLSGWRFDDNECPYAVNSQRGLFRDILARLEAATPGTRHALLATLDTLRPLLAHADVVQGKGLRACSECGEPSAGAVCKTCALGEIVRDRLAATVPS